MALIRCPDCGKMISSLSPACIGCGRPVDTIQETKETKLIDGEELPSVTAEANLPTKEILPPGVPRTEQLDQLFAAKQLWDAGDHSEDNYWANWKYEEALKIQNPHCGTFEWWNSIDEPTPSKLTVIERKVDWAEIAFYGLKFRGSSSSFTVVSDYVRSDGTSVNSHLRKI